MTPANKSERWREALKFISACPICRGRYEPSAARLFAKKDNASLIHLTCSGCQSNFIAMILEMGPAISSIGMVSELSFADAARLHRAEPFSMDEALEVIEKFKKEDFNLSEFINSK